MTFEMSHEMCDCDECFIGNLSSCLYGKNNAVDAEFGKQRGSRERVGWCR